jgi:hypothetical protein
MASEVCRNYAREPMFRLALLFFAAFAAGTAGCDGCDPQPTNAEKLAKSASSPPSATPPAAEAKPAARAPLVIVEDAATMIDGDRVEVVGPDFKGRLAAALSGKKVEGETIAVVAARDVKMPTVAHVVRAIAAAKPKAVIVKTAKRDRSTAEIPIAIDARREGCAAVGYIAKDSAINAWPASGATAARFTRGMAGPDITRGSEGIRKQMAACDVGHWFIAADDGVTWGLLLDLVVAVGEPDDGGAPPRAREVAILAKAVPGRKIEED